MIRDSTRAVQELRTELGEIRERTAPPGPSQTEQDQRFWKEPTKVITELIQGEMKRTVDPINARLQRSDSETALDRAKTNLKARFGEDYAAMEPLIDQFVANAAERGVAIDDAVLQTAAITAYGSVQFDRKMNPKPAAPVLAPTPEPVKPVTPPHARPSTAQIPGREAPAAATTREFTENERRLMRERKMTEQQYVEWLDVPADQVVHSQKIMKPEGAAK